MMAPLLVIGKTGQLARALSEKLSEKEGLFLDRQGLDLALPKDKIQETLQSLPAISGVILASAYTAVDQAEIDQETAFAVNGTAPGIIATFCKNHDIPMVHVSTDYVFQGEADTPYKPDTPVNPINIYGASKLQGERAVQAACSRSAILRTSWVFDGTGKNFLTTMLKLGQDREELTVVSDQIGRPTYAGHLANACLLAIKGLQAGTVEPGLYHVSGAGEPCHWAAFAEVIFEKTAHLRNHKVRVKPIPSSDYPTPAKRPAYSVLDLNKFESATNTSIPSWLEGLDEALKIYDSTINSNG